MKDENEQKTSGLQPKMKNNAVSMIVVLNLSYKI